jgi:hypothetical protein
MWLEDFKLGLPISDEGFRNIKELGNLSNGIV